MQNDYHSFAGKGIIRRWNFIPVHIAMGTRRLRNQDESLVGEIDVVRSAFRRFLHVGSGSIYSLPPVWLVPPSYTSLTFNQYLWRASVVCLARVAD